MSNQKGTIKSIKPHTMDMIPSWDSAYVITVVAVVQSLCHVQLTATTWTTACQASQPITSCQSLLKLLSIELVIPSNHALLCHPLLLLPQSFPASGSFLMSRLFTSGGQRNDTSASASVLLRDIQEWFPLGLTGLIPLLSKGPSRAFSNIPMVVQVLVVRYLLLLINSPLHSVDRP